MGKWIPQVYEIGASCFIAFTILYSSREPVPLSKTYTMYKQHNLQKTMKIPGADPGKNLTVADFVCPPPPPGKF